MATWIECDNGHKDWKTSKRVAPREIGEHGHLGLCPRCGAKKHYIVSHYYPYDAVTLRYEVVASRLRFSADEAESQGWDPMILLMKDSNGDKVVWPYYWTKDRNGKWANGQYPPLLTIDELRAALQQFG